MQKLSRYVCGESFIFICRITSGAELLWRSVVRLSRYVSGNYCEFGRGRIAALCVSDGLLLLTKG